MMSIFKRVFNPDQFTGYHMTGVLALFFGTIISVNMVLAFSAASTWTGLIVKNTYVESQNFNEKLGDLETQATLGWNATISMSAGNMVVALSQKDGAPLHGAIVTANLGRPVHEGEDRTISFVQSSNDYTAPLSLEPGIWRLQITAIGPKGEPWLHTIRFMISENGEVI